MTLQEAHEIQRRELMSLRAEVARCQPANYNSNLL